jgi:OmpA-OmpF porin, OOP family
MKPNSSLRPNLKLRGLLAGSLAVLGMLPVNAYAQAVAKNEFTVQRFDPAPGPRNFFVTRTARSDGNKTWSAGFYGGYAKDPLVIFSCINTYNCRSDSPMGDLRVVKALIAGDLMGSFTLMPPLQFGLRVPLIFVNGQGLDPTDGSMLPGGTKKFALGDPAVEAKYRFFGNLESPFAVAGAVFVTAPLGHAMAKGAYIGDQSPTFGLRGIADVQFGDLFAAANLVGMWRSAAEIGATKIGPELRYSAAVGYHIGPIVRVMVEGLGNTGLKMDGDGSNGLEALLGAQITPPSSPLTFSLGGGTRVIEGVGIPTFRLFAGMMYSAEARDRDGDGILDDKDSCPTVAEDLDGFEDSDGCPDPDNDGDRFLDTGDKCPNEAEDMDGFEDTDGCPDLDNDKDGIPDERDACRDQPETKNGFKDEDGCPDQADSDADGVPDAVDKCPNEPEDTDGFEDTDGCPDVDNDKDGIPDAADECSEEPETMNGFEDTNGCPDENPDPKAAKKKQ